MSVCVNLTTPITVSGKEVSELTFNPPRAGDLRAASRCISELDAVLTALAGMARVSNADFDQIAPLDLLAIHKATEPMLAEVFNSVG